MAGKESSYSGRNFHSNTSREGGSGGERNLTPTSTRTRAEYLKEEGLQVKTWMGLKQNSRGWLDMKIEKLG